MNKPVVINLLKVNKWLKLPDAAKHLSRVCAREVTEVDILRWALDGYLKLSVYFINGAEASKAHLFDELLIKVNDEVKFIDGVWDLPMVGSEKQVIENEYQRLTGGPAVIVRGFGVCVRHPNGELWRLQEPFGHAKNRAESMFQEMYTKFIAENKSGEEETNKHNEKVGKGILAMAGLIPAQDCSHRRAMSLPQDSVLVVRSQILEKCAQLLNDNELELENNLKINRTDNGITPPNIKRVNNFNSCIAQAIIDFTEDNDYAPTTVEEVINRIKHKPPLGAIVNFQGDEVRIDGSKPKTIDKLERAIRRLLEQQKSTA